jgi:hypothetical protein
MAKVYISIGASCNMNYQINKQIGKKETLFFDNLLICVDSVISILSSFDNIEQLLYFENVVQKPNDPIFNSVNSKIIIKSLPFCEFIHDVKIDFTSEDILDFIEKYKRRFLRIINYIRGCDKIVFCRYGNISLHQKRDFIEQIKKINPDCKFCLVSINSNKEVDSIRKEENFLEINIKNPDIPYVHEWTTSYLDWKKIFMDIENNT